MKSLAATGLLVVAAITGPSAAYPNPAPNHPEPVAAAQGVAEVAYVPANPQAPSQSGHGAQSLAKFKCKSTPKSDSSSIAAAKAARNEQAHGDIKVTRLFEFPKPSHFIVPQTITAPAAASTTTTTTTTSTRSARGTRTPSPRQQKMRDSDTDTDSESEQERPKRIKTKTKIKIDLDLSLRLDSLRPFLFGFGVGVGVGVSHLLLTR